MRVDRGAAARLMPS